MRIVEVSWIAEIGIMAIPPAAFCMKHSLILCRMYPKSQQPRETSVV
jgi:hypothetical protein